MRAENKSLILSQLQSMPPREGDRDSSALDAAPLVSPISTGQNPLSTCQNATAENVEAGRPELRKPLLPPPTVLAEPRHPPRPSGTQVRTFERIGLLATTILALGIVVILAALAFLTFLWFANSSNPTWHQIAVTNWMTRSIALTALFLRITVSMQASVLTALLAGVALEGKKVLAIQLASISAMRNANSGPLLLAWQSLRALLRLPGRMRKVYLPLAIIVLVVSTFLIQFSSTALLADLQLRSMPGDSEGSVQGTNFIYSAVSSGPALMQVNRATSWTLHPPFFPTFAEYSKKPETLHEGVRDTGLTLRAFLPLEDQQSRYSIRNYSGRATVVDSSVVCMRPNLTETNLYNDGSLLTFVSQVEPSVTLPAIVTKPDEDDTYAANYRLPYSACNIVPSSSSSAWGLSICQIQGAGSLASALTNTSANVIGSGVFGATYLALNFTSGTSTEWFEYMGGDLKGIGVGGFKPPLFADNNEWLDLIFTGNGSLQLSVSLCYAAWESADLVINAFASQNRTEPTPVFDHENTRWRYNNIRRQLGQSSGGSWIEGMFEDRGLLQLEKRPSWLPSGADYVRPYLNDSYNNSSWPFQSFLLNAAKMEGPGDLRAAISSNISAIATGDSRTSNIRTAGNLAVASITPDQTMTGILQEILQNGGDIAHALQSFVTISSGLTYYDQLPQFNGKSSVHQTMLTFVLVPVRHRGYVAVIAVSLVHLLLAAFVVGLFTAKTSISTVGNAWQSLSQIKDIKTEDLLDHATLSTDSNVKSWMKRKEVDDAEVKESGQGLLWYDVVGIELSETGDRTQVVGGSSHDVGVRRRIFRS